MKHNKMFYKYILLHVSISGWNVCHEEGADTDQGAAGSGEGGVWSWALH